ncbi:AraC family transcriptional regulator [Pinisolibacter sp.]|uniref:AraC family transcriptional regulator n=1 Tax=Pinisolibacter sp. TaxID=2172024 RepID=UPI002FDE87F9
MKRATVAAHRRTPINYIPQIAQQVAAHGVDVAAWLARAGLDESSLSRSGNETEIATYRALIDDAVASTGESGLGLLVGRGLAPSAHGIMGLAATAAGSIQEAMEIVATYVPLRTSMVAIRTKIHGDTLCVSFDPAVGLGSTGHVVSEIALFAVKNIADSKTLAGSACKRIAFQMTEPSHAKLARSLLGCPVDYGQNWTGMIFNLSDAQRVLTQRDTLVMSEALAVCKLELDRLSSAHTITARLERLMLENKSSFPSLSVSARLLNMTPRTLHRRLHDEGASYMEILDNVRCRLAREYLNGRNMSVKEAGYLLGFTDTANFRRAYRRWYGVPPSQL